MRPGPPPGTPGGVQIPLTEEWFRAQKKALKEAGIEKYNAASNEASDVYSPSEAAQKIPGEQQEKFLANVMPSLLEMDENDENFLPDATEKLVGSALEQEFGEEIQQKPGFPQMQQKISRTILSDDRYREVVVDFLNCVLQHKGRTGEEPAPAPQE
ncbi:hypothetical protein DYH09_06985 [bacterium CPR1]|nr:hypothetical protein [bacterium CPR1]